VIDSLRSFDLVQVMTRGNQGTRVLANYMYIEAFNNYRMGYAPRSRSCCFTTASSSSVSTCGAPSETSGVLAMATLARTQNASQVSGVAPVRERFTARQVHPADDVHADMAACRCSPPC